MRHLLAAILCLALPTAATAQPAKGKDYLSLVEVGTDPDTGARKASSVNAAEVKEKRGYSPGAESALVFWVEARKPESGPAQVILAGERLRYIVSSEAPKQKEFGPWDPPEPAYVGSPWQDADIRYRGSRVECISDAFWCWQTWSIEIVLPDAAIRSMVTNPKKKDLPVSLSKRRRVEWRTPREELIATLDKLGVLAEFTQ